MNTDVFILDGRAYSWRALCEQRRMQLEAIRKARGTQPTLFALQDDQRPRNERTTAGRYAQPNLLDWRDGVSSTHEASPGVSGCCCAPSE